MEIAYAFSLLMKGFTICVEDEDCCESFLDKKVGAGVYHCCGCGRGATRRYLFSAEREGDF